MKQPPKEKVYEAFSAIADGRVNMKEDHAEVTSSNGDKTYEVQWRDNMAASSDPATYWQGYPGYPLIAVWILQGKLQADRTIMSYTAGIPWKKLNDACKRDYARALELALQDNPHKDVVLKEGEKVNAQLAKMDVTLKRKIPALK